MVFFCCGILGHNERTCERKMNDATTNTLKEEQYGEWLRANNIRTVRRIIRKRGEMC